MDEWMDGEQACLIKTYNFRAILRIKGPHLNYWGSSELELSRIAKATLNGKK